MENETMPLTWKERLLPLKVGGCETIQENESAQAAYSAIYFFRNSDDPELNSREYSVRKGKVWRIK